MDNYCHIDIKKRFYLEIHFTDTYGYYLSCFIFNAYDEIKLQYDLYIKLNPNVIYITIFKFYTIIWSNHSLDSLHGGTNIYVSSVVYATQKIESEDQNPFIR